MVASSDISDIRTKLAATSLSTLLVIGGIILFVGTLTVSAAVAPSIGQTTTADEQPRTLVGS